MKRFFSVMILLCMMLLVACTDTPPDEVPDTPNGEVVKITLCMYPVGGYEKVGGISSIITAFHNKYHNIRVNVETVPYNSTEDVVDGDTLIEQAITEGNPPDIVLEGPERLVANWGARGLMADLSDIWQDEISSGIYENVKNACHDASNKYYIYPLCMSAHCMAINRDLFEAADALRFLDEETRTWTTDNFVKAVNKVYEYGSEHGLNDVASIYCGGNGGDQGTRALVTNLCGGSFTNPEHTRYTVSSEANRQALELLKGLSGVKFDANMAGGDEIKDFCEGKLAMSFCWNVANELNAIRNYNPDFDILPMAFPTNQAKPKLQSGIWGFGIFDNHDEAKLSVAKQFIRFVTQDTMARQAVLTSTFWPVRDMPNIYEGDELKTEYGKFAEFIGDYYQITPNWAQARTAWYEMLQSVGNGDDISAALSTFDTLANKGIE